MLRDDRQPDLFEHDEDLSDEEEVDGDDVDYETEVGNRRFYLPETVETAIATLRSSIRSVMAHESTTPYTSHLLAHALQGLVRLPFPTSGLEIAISQPIFKDENGEGWQIFEIGNGWMSMRYSGFVRGPLGSDSESSEYFAIHVDDWVYNEESVADLIRGFALSLLEEPGDRIRIDDSSTSEMDWTLPEQNELEEDEI